MGQPIDERVLSVVGEVIDRGYTVIQFVSFYVKCGLDDRLLSFGLGEAKPYRDLFQEELRREDGVVRHANLTLGSYPSSVPYSSTRFAI